MFSVSLGIDAALAYLTALDCRFVRSAKTYRETVFGRIGWTAILAGAFVLGPTTSWGLTGVRRNRR